MASPTDPATARGPTPAALSAGPPPKLRPRRAWYVVALLAFLASIVWIGLGTVALTGQVEDFQRVALPGDGEVTLDSAEGYVIYYEGPGAAAGNVPAFDVTITPVTASAEIESLEPDVGTTTYAFGTREGVAVLDLQVASPGTFLIETADAPVVAGGSFLAVGSSMSGSIVGVVVPGVVVMLTALGGAIGIAIVRHSRAKRAQAQRLNLIQQMVTDLSHRDE